MEDKISMENQDSLNDAKKILANFQEDIELSKIEELIKDNKIEFENKDKVYRVGLLTLKQKEELYMMKLTKFGQLIKNKDILMEKDLIKIYSERGINIDELIDKIKKFDAEILTLKLSLGEAIEKNEPETILKTYEERIITLNQSKQLIVIQKTNYLSTSLESQLENYEAQFITYLTLELFNDGKWERPFKNFEEFQNCEDEDLINKAGTRSILLQYF